MKSFFEGFEKRALMETRLGEAAASGGAGMLNTGTTLHTALSERPPEHSKAREWLGRNAGFIAGAIPGVMLGSSTSPAAVRLLGRVTGGIGEGLVDYAMKGKYYDKNGKIKKKYKKYT